MRWTSRLLPPRHHHRRPTFCYGSTQKVGWSITANHGGGYAYRLCAKTGALDEACFQAGHLAFANNHSWIQRGTDRQQIPAKRLSTGTHPAGSEWSMNPIPACSGTSGGVGQGFNCSGAPPQFAPPLPGLFGYGTAECFNFWRAFVSRL